MTISEETALLNEVETLTNDNQRKARVIAGLYELLLKTEDINLIADAGKAMLEAQGQDVIQSN